jgi:hypothetical protein
VSHHTGSTHEHDLWEKMLDEGVRAHLVDEGMFVHADRGFDKRPGIVTLNDLIAIHEQLLGHALSADEKSTLEFASHQLQANSEDMHARTFALCGKHIITHDLNPQCSSPCGRFLAVSVAHTTQARSLTTRTR